MKNQYLESWKWLRQQLHLSPSDFKVSCISNVLLTVMLCTTLQPNGKFSGNLFVVGYGFNKLRAIRNQIPWVDLWSLSSAYFYLFVLNSAQFSGEKQLEIWIIVVSWDLFERKLAVRFLFHYSRKEFLSKRFDPKHWWEVYLVAYGLFSLLTRSVTACLHAHNKMGSFFLPSKSKYVVSFNNIFGCKWFLKYLSVFVDWWCSKWFELN